MIDIRYINYGIGFCIGQTIYLNKALSRYPELKEKVLQHELKHAQGNHDIDFQEAFDKSLIKFMINNPSSWTQLMPIWIVDGTLTYNRITILCWMLAFFSFSLLLWVYYGL